MNLCIAHGGDMGEPSGGTDRVSTLAAGLAERGFDVTLVVPTTSGEVPDRLEPVNLEFVDPPVSNALARASAVVRRADRIARREEAMLQIEHSSLAGIGTIHGVDEFVLDMHDLAFSRFDHVGGLASPTVGRGVRWLEARAVDRARHVIVVSETMADFLYSTWDVPPEDITVVPNGYHPATIEPVRDVETEPGRAAFLGTLHPKVDVELLGAVAKLEAVSELVVIGDGAQRASVDRMSGTNDAIRVTGRLPDAQAFELLAGAEVLVNPQTVSAIQRASAPVKLYYYAALGKPMVVTAGPPLVKELVHHDAAATAYSSGSFINRVRALLAKQALADRLASGAGEIAETFEWSRRVQAVIELYE